MHLNDDDYEIFVALVPIIHYDEWMHGICQCQVGCRLFTQGIQIVLYLIYQI